MASPESKTGLCLAIVAFMSFKDDHFQKLNDEQMRSLGGGGSHQPELGVGFKYFLCSPLFGEDSHFD